MENPFKWMIWGENPPFLETSIYLLLLSHRIYLPLTPLRQGANSQEVMTFPQISAHPDAQQNNENGCHLYMRKSDTPEN